MGISTSVLMASDEQIREFQINPEKREVFLTNIIGYFHMDKCYLANQAGRISALIVIETDNENPAFNALRSGDVKYKDASDPTHAIFSATVREVATALGGILESPKSKYDDPRKRSALFDRLRKNWVFRNSSDMDFDELLTYFNRLREFVMDAAEKNMGLVICEYEDW